MRETSKCRAIRDRRGDFERYLRGDGIDIGCGDDCLQVPSGTVKGWDRDDGDATLLESVPDAHFDFVYSSHCLEHVADVEFALANWIRVIKHGGILYIVVPDFELYEKRRWPSCYNSDHKATFSLNIKREQVDRRASHFNIVHDLTPTLQKYGVELLEVRLEDYSYDYGASADLDQTLGDACAQLCVIGRKNRRKGISVLIRNELGAGDHANALPVFRYLYNLGYDVAGHRPYSLYENLPVRNPAPPHTFELRMGFEAGRDIPATRLLSDVLNTLGIDLSGVHFPGLAFSPAELKEVRRLRDQHYINIFPYTSIRQKIVRPQLIKEVVDFLEQKGFPVYSTAITDQNVYPWTTVFRNFHPNHSRHFDRRWMIEIAGAALNICCDGGPLNVSLATGRPTVGLLTIADPSLMTFYRGSQWRAVCSNAPCSPCFRAADYGTKEVVGCTQPSTPCGNHFSLEHITLAAMELLGVGSGA